MGILWGALAAFAAGGALYGLCELIWRGWTHWSMLLAGGMSMLLIYLCCGGKRPLWCNCVLGMALITTVEFVSGCVVNLGLGWRVWDYSHHPGHLLGQVCPLFCGMWFLLSIPAVWLGGRLRRWFGVS